MTISEAHIVLGQKQVELYKSNPGVYIDAFCNGQSLREIISNYYRILTKKGQLSYLETLDTEVKEEIKKMSLEYSAGRLDVDECINLCKLLLILTL